MSLFYFTSGQAKTLLLSCGLPNNSIVNGNLDLSRTPIKSLSDNLKVVGSLNLIRTQIKSLPDNLKVGGNLYLSNTPIQSLPDNLKVGGTIHFKDFCLYYDENKMLIISSS